MSTKAPNLPAENANQVTVSANETRPDNGAKSQPARQNTPSSGPDSMPPRTKSNVLLRAATQYLPPLVVLIVLVALWQAIIVINNVPAFLVPTPFGVVKGFQDNASTLLSASVYTLRDALAGFALAVLVGVLVAMALAQSRMLERAISPYATLLQTIPIVAIAPIIDQLVGIGEPAIIVIAFIIAIFPIISNTLLGLTSIDHNLLNLFQMNNATPWQVLWKLRLPNALPYLLGGLRISSGLAVIGAFVGQVFAGSGGEQGGLGYLIQVAGSRLQMDLLFAAVLMSAVLGIAVFVAVNVVNHFLLHNWHESAVRREN